MTPKNITLILSGQISELETGSPSAFWLRFIELQEKLPANCNIQNIFVHSWNPEYEDLVALVYSPSMSLYEEKNSQSTKIEQKISGAIDNIRSRSRALKLADDHFSHSDVSQVVMVPWGLIGKTSSETSHLIFDKGLPCEYMYLAHHSYIDHGFANSWIICSWELARRLVYFEEFSLQKIAELTQNRGLSVVLKQIFGNAKYTIGEFFRIRLLTIKKILIRIKNASLATEKAKRLRYKICDKLLKSLSKGGLSKEISYFNTKKSTGKSTFTISAELQNYLFKLFVYENGFRDKIRFLLPDDFDNELGRGKLISPTPCILVITSGEKPRSNEVKDLFEQSPMPLQSVYFVTSEAIFCSSLKEGTYVEEKIIPEDQNNYSNSLNVILCFLQKVHPSPYPRLVINDAGVFLDCANWGYLNSLLKYILYIEGHCVVFEQRNLGAPDGNFPDLYFNAPSTSVLCSTGVMTLSGINKLSQTLVNYNELDKLDGRDKIVWPFPFFNVNTPLFL